MAKNTMCASPIDEEKFADLVLKEFPQLEEDFREWHGLEHLQMMELVIFTEKAIQAGDWNIVKKSLQLADTLLRDGNNKIKNAVYVSFLEHLPREGEIHVRIRDMMTPSLQQGWKIFLPI